MVWEPMRAELFHNAVKRLLICSPTSVHPFFLSSNFFSSEASRRVAYTQKVGVTAWAPRSITEDPHIWCSGKTTLTQ